MKTVINQPIPIDCILLDEVNEEKIYVIQSYFNNKLYKLSRVGGTWLFCSIDASTGGHSGMYTSMKVAIKVALNECDPVYELKDQQELAEFILDHS